MWALLPAMLPARRHSSVWMVVRWSSEWAEDHRTDRASGLSVHLHGCMHLCVRQHHPSAAD